MKNFRIQPIDRNASEHGHDVYRGHRHNSAIGQEFDAMCADRLQDAGRAIDLTESVLTKQIAQAETAPQDMFATAYGTKRRLGQFLATRESGFGGQVRSSSRPEIITMSTNFEALPSEQEHNYAA